MSGAGDRRILFHALRAVWGGVSASRCVRGFGKRLSPILAQGGGAHAGREAARRAGVRLTNEQREETEWFRGQIAAVVLRARVVPDVEGWPMTPGQLGRVEAALDRSLLAVYTDRMRMVSKLLVIPGVRRHQVGELEAQLLFPADDPECLREVLRLVRARVRRSAATGNVAALVRARGARGSSG